MIEDTLDGKERRRLLVIEPTIYALENCNSKLAAAKFLGISVRALTNRIKQYKELELYKGIMPPHLRNKDVGYLQKYYEKNVRYFDDKTRKQYESYLGNSNNSGVNKTNSEYNGQDTSEDA